MRLLTIISVITVTFAGASDPNIVESQAEDAVSLADAVSAFNAEAAKNFTGKDQSPMTEEEVVAAIRAWEREEGSPVSDELCHVFKQIAKTRKLPKNAEFEKITGWIPKGDFHYDVWWVRIMFTKEDGSTCSLPIRQRMIRSTPCYKVPEELKFLPQGPYPPSYAYEYQEWCTTRVEASFQALKAEIKALRQQLRRLEKRLTEVEKGQHK